VAIKLFGIEGVGACWSALPRSFEEKVLEGIPRKHQ